MRRGFKKRIEDSVTQESSKYSDGAILKEFCCISDYTAVEFKHVKEKLELKYGFKFKNYHKRSDAVEQWEKEKDALSVVKKGNTKKPKLKAITENDWGNSCKEDLSPTQALQRFYKLKEEEKRQRLLEEVRNVDLLIS
jgi:ribosomal protein L11 methylase PrmA